MDITKLTRDSKYVLSALKELPNGSVVCTMDCKIQVPSRFTERSLVELGADIHCIGVYAMIVDDKYAVSTINAQLLITPSKILKININDVEYYEFYFESGSQVFATTNLVKKDSLVYHIFDELISKANVPWYIGYDDLGKIFDSAKYHAGTNIADNQELTELIVSIISRDPIDKTIYYRNSIKNEQFVKDINPEYVSLSNVLFSATSTLTRLTGSYMSEGIVSALVNESQREERLEALLRK